MVLLSLDFQYIDLCSLGWKRRCPGQSDSEKGQVLLSWLLILSMLLTVILAASSAQVLLDHQLELTQTCRKGGLQTQEIASKGVRRLLALNPSSNLLRVKLALAKVKLAQAMAAMNPAFVAIARAELSEVENAQRSLDRLQKSIIQETNRKILESGYQTYGVLQKKAIELQKRSSAWADLRVQLEAPRIPRIALKEGDRMLAPNYIPLEDFELKQRVQFLWSQKYQLKGFFQSQHKTNHGCQTTLEVDSWIPKIRKAKPLSKWL